MSICRAVQTETLVDHADLRLGRLRVRQEDPARAAFDDGRRDGGIANVGERLRREDHRDIFLAQCLEPLPDARGEHGIIEKEPRLIEDQAASVRRRSVRQSVRTDSAARRGPPPCCASAPPSRSPARSAAEPIVIGIEELAVRAAEHVGLQGLAERIRLQQHREPGHRALLDRSAGETCERRPDGFLLRRPDGDAFVDQAAFDPFGGPGPIASLDRCGPGAGRRIAVRAEVVVLATRALGPWRASSGPCRRRRSGSPRSGETAARASRAGPTCPSRSDPPPACGRHRRDA
jgi:hypothetical protein